MEENSSTLFKNMQFAAEADIYMNEKWNSAACNENHWYLYNSRADTYINWSNYQSSLYIFNNMS